MSRFRWSLWSSPNDDDDGSPWWKSAGARAGGFTFPQIRMPTGDREKQDAEFLSLNPSCGVCGSRINLRVVRQSRGVRVPRCSVHADR